MPEAAAYAATTAAQVAGITNDENVALLWDAAVAEWEAMGNVHEAAAARLAQATALLAQKHLDEAKAAVDLATEVADRLGAGPLRNRADRIRDRLRLTSDSSVPGSV